MIRIARSYAPGRPPATAPAVPCVEVFGILVRMISDSLDNASSYLSLTPRIATALKFLQTTDLQTISLGKHQIDGENIFAMVQQYMTKTPDKAFWEAHRRYIDVQHIVSGIEAMGFSPLQQMTVVKDYDAEKEYTVLQGSGQFINLTPGNFVIFFPHDAHMGGIAIAEPGEVRKIVIKVAV